MHRWAARSSEPLRIGAFTVSAEATEAAGMMKWFFKRKPVAPPLNELEDLLGIEYIHIWYRGLEYTNLCRSKGFLGLFVDRNIELKSKITCLKCLEIYRQIRWD